MNAPLHEFAARTLAGGSSSFAAAARLFDPKTRANAMLLYAWCRYCDDLIDDQVLGHAADARLGMRLSGEEALDYLERETERAMAGRPSDTPPFLALAELVRSAGIRPDDAREHLAGFRMDVDGARYDTLDDLLLYCWRIAGVVGVMMSAVMGRRDDETLDYAADLGLAFQLTNIARDVVEDARRGRIYLPSEWLAEADLDGPSLLDPRRRTALAGVAARLLDAAEPYYASAGQGISRLPFRSACAVSAAAGIYRQIGLEVRRNGPSAWDGRVRTSGLAKARLGLAGIGLAIVSRTRAPRARDPHLWTRPR